MTNSDTPMALAGIKVLDLSRILAGPYAAQMFADLGADVVKVENPNGGDDTRKWGPPFTKNADGSRDDAAYFNEKAQQDWQALRAATPDLPVEPIKTITNDHFIGPGYGRADQAVFDTLAELARLEGITLDPVYTGKAFHGMVTDLEHSSFQSDAADIIFVHTGGVFGIFPHADALQTSLQRV